MLTFGPATIVPTFIVIERAMRAAPAPFAFVHLLARSLQRFDHLGRLLELKLRELAQVVDERVGEFDCVRTEMMEGATPARRRNGEAEPNRAFLAEPHGVLGAWLAIQTGCAGDPLWTRFEQVARTVGTKGLLIRYHGQRELAFKRGAEATRQEVREDGSRGPYAPSCPRHRARRSHRWRRPRPMGRDSTRAHSRPKHVDMTVEHEMLRAIFEFRGGDKIWHRLLKFDDVVADTVLVQKLVRDLWRQQCRRAGSAISL